MTLQKPVRDLALEKGILTKEEADALFDLKAIAENRYRDKVAGTGHDKDELASQKKKRPKQIRIHQVSFRNNEGGSKKTTL